MDSISPTVVRIMQKKTMATDKGRILSPIGGPCGIGLGFLPIPVASRSAEPARDEPDLRFDAVRNDDNADGDEPPDPRDHDPASPSAA